jgi:nucleotide-binding universal stress UspA family protein
MLNIKTILHPTDFSACSEQAFQLACSLARDYGARVIVLHVQVPPKILYGEGVVPPEPAAYAEELKDYLARIQPPDSKIQLEHRLAEGAPFEEILSTAND